MADLGIALITFAPARTQDFVTLGRRAEEAGYAACYTTESLTDTLSIDLAILLGTERIRVGSFVAVSYLRHPVIAAQMATTASDLSGGRFVLGLGLGHRVRVEALGVPVGRPSVDLPAYVRDVKDVLAGRGRQRYPDLPPQSYQGRLLDFRTPEHPVPVYTAAVGPRMAEEGAVFSDGLMVWLVPHAGLGELVAAAGRAGERSGRPAPPVEASVHAFVSDDLDAARSAARSSLSYWVGLPAYNSALARAGFEGEAAGIATAFRAGDTPALLAAISDRLIDEYCLAGPVARCRDQLAGWHETGVTTVLLVPHPVHPGRRTRPEWSAPCGPCRRFDGRAVGDRRTVTGRAGLSSGPTGQHSKQVESPAVPVHLRSWICAVGGTREPPTSGSPSTRSSTGSRRSRGGCR